MSAKLLKSSLILIVILTNTLFACAQSSEEFIKSATEQYREGNYQKAAELFDKAIFAGNEHNTTYYNAACSWALAGNTDKAYDRLENAVDKGYLDVDWIKQDKDLTSLHDDPRWSEMIAMINNKIEKREESFPMKHKYIKTIDLPEPKTTGQTSVAEAINNRRSRRTYAPEPLTLTEISQVLWAAYGITRPIDNGPDFIRGGLRSAPSAGALYPLEIYLVVGNVDKLEPGIYHYDSRYHRLQLMQEGDFRRKTCDAANGQLMIERAAAVMVYSAIFERTTGKYGSRGRERYVCMDMGHSAENVYLQAEALGLGTCAVGAFNDFALKSVINMTRPEEPLYLMPLGKQK